MDGPLASQVATHAVAARWHERPAVVAALLGVILLLGLALRLRVGLDTTYISHPDETYDYLEQGFRLVFGYGTLTWTYEYGLRSYVFPGLIAAIIGTAHALGLSPDGQLNAVAAVMALLSLSVVACAFAWGHRAAGLAGAVLAGFLAAVWFELVYFAPRTLQEVMATNALVIAACLCPDRLAARPGAAGRRAPQPARRLVLLGFFLGLAVALRVQLGPTAVVIGLWLLWHDPRQALTRVLPASILPVLAFGLLDGVTHEYPFQSFVMNVYANSIAGVSDYYGVSPWYELFNLQAHYQGGAAFVALGLLALAGATRLPLLLLLAASVYGVFSAVGHKEYRFVYPAIPFVITLAAVGTAMLCDLVRRELPRRLGPAVPAVALGAWGFVSAHAAIDGAFKREWQRGSGLIAAGRAISRLEGVCGIAAYSMVGALQGHVRLRQDVPVYRISTPDRFAEDARSFNVVMAPDSALPPEAGFTLLGCWRNGFNEASQNRRQPHLCVLTRPGPCSPGAVNDPDPDRPPGW